MVSVASVPFNYTEGFYNCRSVQYASEKFSIWCKCKARAAGVQHWSLQNYSWKYRWWVLIILSLSDRYMPETQSMIDLWTEYLDRLRGLPCLTVAPIVCRRWNYLLVLNTSQNLPLTNLFSEAATSKLCQAARLEWGRCLYWWRILRHELQPPRRQAVNRGRKGKADQCDSGEGPFPFWPQLHRIWAIYGLPVPLSWVPIHRAEQRHWHHERQRKHRCHVLFELI